MNSASIVRPVRPSEYDIVGELCVDAYVKAGIVDLDHPYVATLSDTKSRAEAELVDVLVLTRNDRIVGTVTLAPYGSALTTTCRPGEVEPRVLATAVDLPRSGIGRELVEATEQWAIGHGLHTVIVCVADYNHPARAMYENLGFTPDPQRDWVEPSGALLQTFTKRVDDSVATYCPRCGGEPFSGDHEPCRDALELEPPRFCTVCKRRMIVQITPTGWTARCKEHGIQTS